MRQPSRLNRGKGTLAMGDNTYPGEAGEEDVFLAGWWTGYDGEDCGGFFEEEEIEDIDACTAWKLGYTAGQESRA
jgi:hypothetical protein